MDEALALPSEHAARVALRTQQIIAYESGVTKTVDPLAGSYYVEYLTKRVEEGAYDYFEKIDAMGGMVKAIEMGFPQREIAESAYRYQREIDTKERIVVGVNEFMTEEPLRIPILKMDPEGERRHLERLRRVRRERDNRAVREKLAALRRAAKGVENLMPYILEAVREYATLGEIMGVFREVFGEYKEPSIL
jgi:methylmalonyl-CoA mutase N-terminal domain/subunit